MPHENELSIIWSHLKVQGLVEMSQQTTMLHWMKIEELEFGLSKNKKKKTLFLAYRSFHLFLKEQLLLTSIFLVKHKLTTIPQKKKKKKKSVLF